MTDNLACAHCHRITRDSVEQYEQMIGTEFGDGRTRIYLHMACVGAYLIDNPGDHLTYFPPDAR